MARPPAGRKKRSTPPRSAPAESAAGGDSEGAPHSPSWHTPATDTGAAGGHRTLLKVEPQQQTQWCWAAVSNSVAHYFDPASTWTQCAIVNAELGQTGCCATGGSAGCNQPWYLDFALTRVGRLQSVTAGTLPFTTLQQLTTAFMPPCARQGWAGGGGHFVAIVWCALEPSPSAPEGSGATTSRVSISDPWYGDSVVDYSTFVSGYMGTGTWTHSYLTKP